MKCRLPHSAERSGRGALLIFSNEEMSNGSFKLHLRWGGIPTPRFAALPTAHFSGCWHVPECDSQRPSICICRT
jgi:hypothetical protein